MSKNKIAGYICLWSIPDVSVSYDEALRISEDVKFDSAHVPSNPKKRNAWEKATNLGNAGLKIEAPSYKVAEVERKYGVKPLVKLHTQVIKRSSPHLIRHITRTVYVPANVQSSDKKQVAHTQLNQDTVAILEFFTESDSYRFTAYDELPDSTGYINGNLREVLEDLRDAIVHKIDYADGNEVRNGLRNWFKAQNATLMSSGGAYFVPYSPSALDALKSAKAYLEAMTPFMVDPNGRKPQLMIVPLTEEGEAFETRLDVASNAIESFKSELQDLVNELSPVIDGERTKNVSEKVRARVTTELTRLQVNIAQYRDVLGDNLKALDIYLENAQAHLAESWMVKSYKASKADETENTKEVE